jgi:hypothetical protein
MKDIIEMHIQPTNSRNCISKNQAVTNHQEWVFKLYKMQYEKSNPSKWNYNKLNMFQLWQGWNKSGTFELNRLDSLTEVNMEQT